MIKIEADEITTKEELHEQIGSINRGWTKPNYIKEIEEWKNNLDIRNLENR